MFEFLKRVRCECTFCGKVVKIPRKRILRFERHFKIKKGQPFVWECHDCHEGIIIPAPYINIHGERMIIDKKTLDPNTEVIRF
jgi:hypothetical protein